ncbi:MAG: carboxyl transferase domain-containing protein [Candidatus Ventricola sp.]|nr:carboxyl transferase domain-containing protein [Candidatus Ventricola sp.]
MSTLQDLNQVLSRKQDILSGNAAGVEKQKKSGKLTARERIELLLDAGSFVEQGMLVADAGVVTGSGTVDGRPVYVFAQDFAVLDGAVGAKQAKKIVKVLELARKTGTPVVAMCDSNGARVAEGAPALEAYADIFAHMARLSGVVPMISLVLGPCVGAAAMMAELSDLVFVAKPAGVLLMAGPQVLASTMGKSLTAEELGGGKTAVESGAAHFACETEEEAIAQVKTVLGMLPANNLEDAPFAVEEDMNRLVDGLEAGAEGRDVIAKLADTGSVVEVGKGYTGAVTALAKLAGRTVAFVYTGKGDTCDKRMKKITRFVRFADCYNIPVVSLIDSTGLTVFETVDRQMSVLKAASSMIYAYSEATTVKVALVIGNAVGAAYVAMGGSANADATYAWPGTVISPLTGEAAIQVMWKDEIKKSTGDAVAARAELAAKYEAEVADGVNAAAQGLIDDVIDPADSRKTIIAALELLSSKRDSNPPKKHGNMPL